MDRARKEWIVASVAAAGVAVAVVFLAATWAKVRAVMDKSHYLFER